MGGVIHFLKRKLICTDWKRNKFCSIGGGGFHLLILSWGCSLSIKGLTYSNVFCWVILLSSNVCSPFSHHGCMCWRIKIIINDGLLRLIMRHDHFTAVNLVRPIIT